MKRAALIFFAIAIALSLVACTKQTIEITRYEEEPIGLGASSIGASFVSYERFLETYSYYYYDYRSVDSVYLPRQGEFVTADGEVFFAEVEDIKMGHNYMPSQRTSVSFTLKIHSPDGALIAEGQIRSRIESLESEVSENVAKYWEAVKILPEELFQKQREEDEA